jgi:hypothetical protein
MYRALWGLERIAEFGDAQATGTIAERVENTQRFD